MHRQPYDQDFPDRYFKADPFRHPVELLMDGETDPDAIRFATAAHLSEMAVQTDGSARNLHAALRRLEESL